MHARCTAVVRIFVRVLLGWYRRRARRAGLSAGRTGSVTFLQRFGSAANLNLQAHVVLLDGAFTQTGPRLTFRPCEPPTTTELTQVLVNTRTRVFRYLNRCGILDPDPGDGANSRLSPQARMHPGSNRAVRTMLRSRDLICTRVFGLRPRDRMAKLAALVPRPRKNLVLYHGVLAANAGCAHAL